MINPLRFRPGPVPEGDPHADSPVEWADNWLSNLFAWASQEFMPAWCQTPEHWTSRSTAFVFTDCPCCLLFRGIVLGMLMVGSPLIVLLMLTVVVLWR
jgi:hypothetical protein